MSALVEGALLAAGLREVLDARRAGAAMQPWVARLRGADLLALGALADRVRADEVGDGVRIYTAPAADAADLTLPDAERQATGLDLLRAIAVARVTGPRAARVRVDWSRCGIELAQVALGFGASELVGVVTSKRGLPLAEGETLGVGKKSRREAAALVKRREIEALVRRAGRIPEFGGGDT